MTGLTSKHSSRLQPPVKLGAKYAASEAGVVNSVDCAGLIWDYIGVLAVILGTFGLRSLSK